MECQFISGGNMKKVVISGSIKLQKEIDGWREYFSRKNVQCYDEINLWLKLGWIRLYHEEETQ